MDVKHFLLWLPMIAVAFANAAIRELVFINHFSESRAHQFSTATLILLCAVYIWFVFPFLNIGNARHSLIIGFVWVLLTITFEFSLGRMTGKPWADLLCDYNLFAGRIWVIFLFCLFVLPYVFYFIKAKHRARGLK